MPDPIQLATEALKATELAEQQLLQKDKENNTPEMIAAKKSQTEQTAIDKTNQALSAGDLAELRKEIS